MLIATKATDGDTLTTNEISQDVKGELVQDYAKKLETGFKNSIQETQKPGKSQLDDLERRIYHLKEHNPGEAIYGEATIAGPIRKLPAEMLGEVFQYHVESNNSPWILVQVSKYWMRTAMATPQLWSHIRLRDRFYVFREKDQCIVNGKQQFISENEQICRDPTELQAAIGRSGVVPLSFILGRWESFNDPSNIKMLSIILCAPISTRIKYIRTTTHYLARVNLDGLTIGPLTTLKSLELLGEIYFNNSNNSVERLLDAVSLTCRHLQSIILPKLPPSKLKTYSFWRSVRVIGGYELVGKRLNAISDQLVSLEKLYLDPLYSWPDEFTPQSTWKNIRSITLTCSLRHLSRLELPRLETLTFRETEEAVTTPLEKGTHILYPMLINLEVHPQNSVWSYYLADAFPAVTGLTVVGDVADAIVVDILQTIPSARNVIMHSSIDSLFGCQLLPQLSMSESLCPNLKTLELGAKWRHFRTPKKAIDIMLEGLVKNRKQARRPLHRVTVHWKHGTQTIGRV